MIFNQGIYILNTHPTFKNTSDLHTMSNISSVMWCDYNITPGGISLCHFHCHSTSHTHAHRTKSIVLHSFESQTPNVADLISQNTRTHTHTPSILPPWIIPVFLRSYDTLEKLSNLWAPEATSHFERGHPGEDRTESVCVRACEGGVGFMCVTLVNEVAGRDP